MEGKGGTNCPHPYIHTYIHTYSHRERSSQAKNLRAPEAVQFQISSKAFCNYQALGSSTVVTKLPITNSNPVEVDDCTVSQSRLTDAGRRLCFTIAQVGPNDLRRSTLLPKTIIRMAKLPRFLFLCLRVLRSYILCGVAFPAPIDDSNRETGSSRVRYPPSCDVCASDVASAKGNP